MLAPREPEKLSQKKKDKPLQKKPRTIAFEAGGTSAIAIFIIVIIVIALISLFRGVPFAIGGNISGWLLMLVLIYYVGGCIGWFIYACRKSVVFACHAIMSFIRRK